MENKPVAPIRTITGELIGGFLLYGLLFSLLYNVVYSAITDKISSDSLILSTIIAIILQGISVFCVWRCSIFTTFKKRALYKNDLNLIMKNLMIFTVILCLVDALLNFSKVNKQVEETINSDPNIIFSEHIANSLYDDDEIAEYKSEKEKAVNEVKSKLYAYLIILEIGLVAVYLGVLPLQKKAISKYAV